MKANVKRSDIVYSKHRDLVDAEIAKLLGVPVASTTTPGWFGKRMVAVGNVIAGMTSAQLAQLDADVAIAAEDGLPAEEQNRWVHIFTGNRFNI